MNKRIRLIICGIIAVSMCAITGCSNSTSDINTKEAAISTAEVTSAIKKVTAQSLSEKDVSVDEEDSIYSNNITSINLSKSSAKVEGNGAKVEGTVITISEAGTYTISGDIEDGQIVVDASDDDKIKIVLNGVNIKNSKSSAIYIKNADKTIISLKDGTNNYIEDGQVYEEINSEDNEPNAAIFSKDDLIISGSGSLEVKSNYKDGITSKDDLIIAGGDININSTDDGIKGKDSVTIVGGSLNIISKGDGIKSTNTKDEKGYIYIQNGTINIQSEKDGIQAENSIVILNGDINIESGSGSKNAPEKSDKDFGMNFKDNVMNNDKDQSSSDSKKGLKSELSVEINGGNLNIDSYDDAINSGNEVIIASGIINIASGDDGIHGDSSVTIDGGEINISKSYEGIEGENITINDGDIHVKSSDDGVNAAEAKNSEDTLDYNNDKIDPKEQQPEGNGQNMKDGQPPEDNRQMMQEGQKVQDDDKMMQRNQDQKGFVGESAGNAEININGGYLYVDADGDGIDANGSIKMSGGTVIVNGPTNDGNGSIDYDSSCEITGGILIASGSSGMLQAPSSSSAQHVISAVFSNSLQAGTSINIKSETGENILTFTPNKEYQSIILCSPDVKKGETYTISAGGIASGESKDGLYTNSTFSNSTESINCTVSDIITNAGSQNDNIRNGDWKQRK